MTDKNTRKPYFEVLEVVIVQNDISNGRIHLIGTYLPLNESAKVGDTVSIPVPIGKFRIRREYTYAKSTDGSKG